MKALFVCNLNRNRSKTAELIFKNKFETKSAGLFSGNPITEELLLWADIVFVMEDFQRTEIGKRFPSMYLQKKIVNLDVPDYYNFNQAELIELLEKKMKKLGF
jgi:predicted protein tyrosine phosphatase